MHISRAAAIQQGPLGKIKGEQPRYDLRIPCASGRDDAMCHSARPSASNPLTLVGSGRARRLPTRQPPPQLPSVPTPECARLSLATATVTVLVYLQPRPITCTCTLLRTGSSVLQRGRKLFISYTLSNLDEFATR